MSASKSKRFDLDEADAERLLREAREHKGISLWQDASRRLRRNRPSWYALVFLIGFGLLSFLAPLLPLRSPVRSNLDITLSAPTLDGGDSNYLATLDPQADSTTITREIEKDYWELSGMDHGLISLRRGIFGSWQTGHWLGTDHLGRDLLSRIVWGSRTSILVSLAAALCSLLIGVFYGSFSGLAGGRIDNLMMRIVDILYSIPFIFVVIFLITLIGDHRQVLEEEWGLDREKVFYLVIGAVYWLTMARVVRGQVLSLKHTEFVQAARVMGASTLHILGRHIVPNVLSVVIVYLTLTIPAVMLFEAFLSFLGLGVEPPRVSWGLIAVDGTSAINPLRIHWWVVVFPALAMGSTLLALNVLGDGLRDALDPKMRGKE
ncbi:MAG TPA: ABC transporter permease [Planctomycetes bacterium]|nr:ABC transporter permease [Planctomycetota bacterium]HIL36812.1 ABC transporter permease [Planctomycetota bacterium]